MRGTRWILLAAIVAILCYIGVRYRAQLKVLRVRDQALTKPAPLPNELNSASVDWCLAQTDTRNGTARTTFKVCAQDFQELKDSSRADLKGVTLRLSSKKGDTYDLIKSAAASFYKSDQHLYSDGDVDITLNVPVEGVPKRALVSVKSSGVTYDTNGRAETDRPSSFSFERGSGTATGAAYDPASRQLLMKSDVVMDYMPIGPHAKPMKIEAGSLEYHETEAQILLKPWGRLTRDKTVVEGQNVVVHLEDDGDGHKVIRGVYAMAAHGTDIYPTRKVQYSADELWLAMDEDGVVQRITAQTNAQLVSTSDTAETTVTADRVDMNFVPEGHESLLSDATATGNAVITSKPLPGPGRQPGETHILRSEKLDMRMRPGGRDLESVVTHTPGTLEFVPNQPVQHHRLLEGNDMVITYGPENRVESFHTTNARTRTEPTDAEKKRNRVASVTNSRDLVSHFEPKTGRMVSTEQSGDFTYDEGDRHARAAKATLDSDQSVILLDTSARMWDATGSTSADHIRMDEKTGDFTAEGGVNSSRLPDKDQKKNSEMLSGDQPLQAQARKMDSKNHNRSMHYEGDVTMWQGANRIQGDVIDVDREKRTLVADGNVVTNLWEEHKDDPKNAAAKKKPAADPVLTVVHAPHLVYTEENRLAVYTGGVLLNRPGLDVKAKEVRAFLADKGGDSQLEKAFADGAVQITQVSREGTRIGTSEHAEYYTADQKVFLRDGRPKLVEHRVNGKDNTTEGVDLTYFANDDRLLVNGSRAQPGQSQIKRK
jgi:lipopolysaccharide export system protein LptA